MPLSLLVSIKELWYGLGLQRLQAQGCHGNLNSYEKLGSSQRMVKVSRLVIIIFIALRSPSYYTMSCVNEVIPLMHDWWNNNTLEYSIQTAMASIF